jgi:hypothetical protein
MGYVGIRSSDESRHASRGRWGARYRMVDRALDALDHFAPVMVADQVERLRQLAGETVNREHKETP